jgi:hypothetical protein
MNENEKIHEQEQYYKENFNHRLQMVTKEILNEGKNNIK